MLVLLVCANTVASQDSPEVTKAKAQLSRIEQLVEAGGLPRNRLVEAREAVAEAEDYAVLRRTLFGSLKVEELSDALNQQMTDTAKRLVDRQQKALDRQRQMVESGVAGRTSLTALVDELDARRKTLDLAESRVRLWAQLTEMAQAEHVRQAELEAEQLEALARSEADPAYGILPPAKLKRLEQEFERTFQRPLPVSAHGDTSFHRSLGFNHTGRVDVGVNPDSSEGRWLRDWLDGSHIPYLYFRTAIRGVSSAPHVHIGPPSTRLKIAD